MPYIAIRAYPKDEKTKETVIEEINQVFLKHWGCPQEAITISLEEIAPAEWNEKVVEPLIKPNLDKMRLLSGKKPQKTV